VSLAFIGGTLFGEAIGGGTVLSRHSDEENTSLLLFAEGTHVDRRNKKPPVILGG